MPVTPAAQEPPVPSRMTDCFGPELTGGPSPISFRKLPVRLYWNGVPLASAVSVIVTVIDVGAPEQSVVGEHVTVAVATLDATARSLTSTPPWHSRRSSEYDGGVVPLGAST